MSKSLSRSTEVLRYAAFGEVTGGGNPAGVVLDATGLDDSEMLAIAAEVGFSETAFVTPGDEAYGMRYFSPLAEVPFCGHATVATAVAFAERHGAGLIVFDTPVGRVPVETAVRADGRVAATFTSVETSTKPATQEDLAQALACLRWTVEDLDPAYPPHVANGGNDHLVLAVRTRERLAALDYDFDRLADLMAARNWTTVHLVWAESTTVFHARDPFPPGGILEDAATGAAAAAFGGYLRDLGLAHDTVVIHQGEDMGSPSVLTVQLNPATRKVRVTGTAIVIENPTP